jgi:hypothetical protein
VNGPQHYARAERLLTAATELDDYNGEDAAASAMRHAAEVHATLALAAATADAGGLVGVGSLNIPSEWARVTSA